MTARAFTVRSGWLTDEGRRLDASTYRAGALQVRARIMNGPWTWRPLGAVSRLYTGSRFTRTYVSDAGRGVPYLTGTDMLAVDLNDPLYLSVAKTPQLDELRVHKAWTLVSCSGTVGRTVFVRADMDGMAASHDVIRCIPVQEVLPGYLFAFLSSTPGQAMIRQRTYGSVVQHIEPAHIADLPVPILEMSVQESIDGLVGRAATARAQASRLLDEAAAWFNGQVPNPQHGSEHSRAVGLVRASRLDRRLDAFHHVGWAAEATLDGERLGDLADVVATARVPRVYVERGVPFLSGIDVFRTRPTVRVRLARHIATAFDALVHAGEIAVQGSGQRYGLLGRVAYIGQQLDGWAASHDLFRIVTGDPVKTARLFAYLRSDVGHRAMLRHSYGTSIPHVNPAGIAAIRVPPTPVEITGKAARALELRERADADEQLAAAEVERWLG